MKQFRQDLGHKVEHSFWGTFIGIFLFFCCAIAITLVVPPLVDPTWSENTSHYQKQLYELGDPRVFISNSVTGNYDLQFVAYMEAGKTLSAFIEGEHSRIVAPEPLKKYISKENGPIHLTNKILFLRQPSPSFKDEVERLQGELKKAFTEEKPNWKEKGMTLPIFQVMELYDSGLKEGFSTSATEGALEDFAESDFVLVDMESKDKGHLFIKNPVEYRVREIEVPTGKGYLYSQKGKPIASLDELKKMGFWSRQELIEKGERIYAIEGCWYCHTDQTRTLVQDVVLNGSDAYPAPPSTASEYIYQDVTFPGTRRIGPDLSRTGVKRPSRDWHKAHFWAPKTASPGSIMPSFQHFFDDDPRGTPGAKVGVPNLQFEAIYQYMMTKGTRLTSPSKAWWLGQDPVNTKEIIDGHAK